MQIATKTDRQDFIQRGQLAVQTTRQIVNSIVDCSLLIKDMYDVALHAIRPEFAKYKGMLGEREDVPDNGARQAAKQALIGYREGATASDGGPSNLELLVQAMRLADKLTNQIDEQEAGIKVSQLPTDNDEES